LVLLKYLENVQEFPYPEFWNSKSIIDIGSGTGVIGIACALLATGIQGTHVTLTDRAPLLDLLRYNAYTLNLIPASRLAVKELEWGNALSNADGTPMKFDIILLSDVVTKAYSESYPGLINTIRDLSNDNSRIILAYELRDPSDRLFFDQLKEAGFWFTKVADDKLDPEFTAEDIGIFEITKQPTSVSSTVSQEAQH
jgi:predicted nicotinamide N-methyase